MMRLEGPDAAFIAGETPEWHFHVTALMVLDPAGGEGWSFERLRDNFDARIHQSPQFRWKLHEDPTGFSRPWMADDPEFDIDNHINRIAVAPPGTDADLTDLVGTLIAEKLDRSRPLWEAWVIEGLEGGRVGMLTKVHHAIIDGDIQMVVNTPRGKASKDDDAYIRQTAIRCKVPYVTTLAAAVAAAKGIRACREGRDGVKNLQQYHASIT